MNRIKNIAFVLLPEFALLSFCSASEPLRVANRLQQSNLYRWGLYSVDGHPVVSSNSMVSQVDGAIDDIQTPDLIVVVASFNPQDNVSTPLLQSLRKHATRGVSIAGIDTGPYILARAGLLDGFEATLHWEDLTNFRQSFPKIKALSKRYVIDGRRLTASGAAASMDMVLELIGREHGNQLAMKIAEQFIYTPQIRLDSEQRLPLCERMETAHPIVLKAVALMENHLEDNLTTAQIAALCDISLRQLERLFRQNLHDSPGRWYKTLKLKNARIQLKQSRYTIAEIAANNGFESASSFSRAYKSQYQRSPSKDRSFTHGI